MILYNDDSRYPPLNFWIMKIKAEITAIYQELFRFVKNSEWTNKKLMSLDGSQLNRLKLSCQIYVICFSISMGRTEEMKNIYTPVDNLWSRLHSSFS